MVNIRLDKPSTTTAMISNIIGQKVKDFNLGTLEVGNNPVTVSVDDLSSGVYYLTVMANGRKHTQKIVKE